MEKAEERVLRVFKKHGYRPLETRSAGLFQLAAQKGVYSRLGVYVTHLSIILIFVGALTGAFFGYKALLNLPEGEASDKVYLRNEPMWDQIMAALGIAKSPVIHNPEGGLPAMPLGYWVQCNNFDVDYYQGAQGPTGMPSEYHSTLSVYNLDKEKVLDKHIRVNDPLSYRGITFYQSSYGPLPDAHGTVFLNVRLKNSMDAGESVAI